MENYNQYIIEFEKEIIEIIRGAYMAGIDDKEEGCEACSHKASRERAKELLNEFRQTGEFPILSEGIGYL